MEQQAQTHATEQEIIQSPRMLVGLCIKAFHNFFNQANKEAVKIGGSGHSKPFNPAQRNFMVNLINKLYESSLNTSKDYQNFIDVARIGKIPLLPIEIIGEANKVGYCAKTIRNYINRLENFGILDKVMEPGKETMVRLSKDIIIFVDTMNRDYIPTSKYLTEDEIKSFMSVYFDGVQPHAVPVESVARPVHTLENFTNIERTTLLDNIKQTFTKTIEKNNAFLPKQLTTIVLTDENETNITTFDNTRETNILSTNTEASLICNDSSSLQEKQTLLVENKETHNEKQISPAASFETETRNEVSENNCITEQQYETAKQQLTKMMYEGTITEQFFMENVSELLNRTRQTSFEKINICKNNANVKTYNLFENAPQTNNQSLDVECLISSQRNKIIEQYNEINVPGIDNEEREIIKSTTLIYSSVMYKYLIDNIFVGKKYSELQDFLTIKYIAENYFNRCTTGIAIVRLWEENLKIRIDIAKNYLNKFAIKANRPFDMTNFNPIGYLDVDKVGKQYFSFANTVKHLQKYNEYNALDASKKVKKSEEPEKIYRILRRVAWGKIELQQGIAEVQKIGEVYVNQFLYMVKAGYSGCTKKVTKKYNFKTKNNGK